MRYILLVCCFALTAIGQAAAQSTYNTDQNFWGLVRDSNCYVFAKKAYLRSGPGIDQPIIDSVVAGTVLVYKEQTTIFSTIRNIYAPWVKVHYQKNGTGTDAYIWLGMLAIGQVADEHTRFVYGLDRISAIAANAKNSDDVPQYVIQVKALSGDTVTAVKEWKIAGDESSSYSQMLLLGNTRLKNLRQVVRINFGGEACGIPTNYYYFGFTGTELLPLPGKYSVGDADVFYHTETILFPNEKGGKEGQLIKLIEEESNEEAEGNKPPKTLRQNWKEVYVWDGVKATKVK